MKSPIKRNKSKIVAFMILFLLFALAVISVFNINGDIFDEQRYHADNTKTINSYATSTSKDWRLILVNSWNHIPKNYEVTLKTLGNDTKIDERIYPDLKEMFDAAISDGVYPLVTSAYRTKSEQENLYSKKVKAYMKSGYSKKEARKSAEAWVAIPGTSEHQLGLAADINAQKDKCTNQKVYTWLNTNGYKYGFILRYPENKAQITGVNYEPWHYRYVGKEAAKEIYEQGICLEEYLG